MRTIVTTIMLLSMLCSLSTAEAETSKIGHKIFFWPIPYTHYKNKSRVFCEKNPGYCEYATQESKIQLTDENAKLLRRGLELYSEAMRQSYTSDIGDDWKIALPGDKGDCEDYTYGLRQQLIIWGLPGRALLPLVGRSRQAGRPAHMVLYVATSKGGRILDLENETLTRWSYDNPSKKYVWVAAWDPHDDRGGTWKKVLGK